ncbi:MAG: hypothetical protein IJT25_00320 [Clostridia bacterium]|nr:hypothetical protein [Clostridia bacterium]
MAKLDLSWLFKTLLDLLKIPSAYHTLKTYPEEAQKSQAIGIRGLIWLIVAIVAGPLAISMFKWAFGLFSTGAVLGGIFLIIISVIIGLYTVITGFLNGLLCSIYQLKLNKRPLGWVDLVLTILLVLEIVFIIFLQTRP